MDRFRCLVRSLRKRGTHYDERSSDLYERVSIIVTSNLRFGDWNTIFRDEKMTDALIGRLTHKGHILEFVGESYRFRYRLQQGELSEGESKPEVG